MGCILRPHEREIDAVVSPLPLIIGAIKRVPEKEASICEINARMEEMLL